MPGKLRLIANSLGKRKVQALAVFISIALCAAVLLASVLVYEGVTRGMATSSERLGADIVVVSSEAGETLDDAQLLFTGVAANYYMDASILDEISEVGGVSRVTPQFFCQTLAESECCASGLDARVIGFDPETDWIIAPWAGDALDDGLDADEIVIGSDIIGVDEGEVLRVLGVGFTVVCKLDYTGTSLDYSVMMDIDTARTLVASRDDYSRYWAEYGSPEELVTAVMVEVDSDAAVDGVATLISYRTGASAVRSGDAIANVQSQTGIVFALMLGAAGLLAISSIVQMFARFYTMTWDRKNEFGLYRALGAEKGTLRGLIFGEMAILVVAGSVVGALVGVGLCHLVVLLVEEQSSFPFAMPGIPMMVGTAACILAAMLVIGLLACAAPVAQISRVSPTLAMQRVNID